MVRNYLMISLLSLSFVCYSQNDNIIPEETPFDPVASCNAYIKDSQALLPHYKLLSIVRWKKLDAEKAYEFMANIPSDKSKNSDDAFHFFRHKFVPFKGVDSKKVNKLFDSLTEDMAKAYDQCKVKDDKKKDKKQKCSKPKHLSKSVQKAINNFISSLSQFGVVSDFDTNKESVLQRSSLFEAMLFALIDGAPTDKMACQSVECYDDCYTVKMEESQDNKCSMDIAHFKHQPGEVTVRTCKNEKLAFLYLGITN